MLQFLVGTCLVVSILGFWLEMGSKEESAHRHYSSLIALFLIVFSATCLFFMLKFS